jgi:hypothetical protein
MSVTRTDWTRAALEAEGFVGWVPFARLRDAGVAAEPGMYLVWRDGSAEPAFLPQSVGGRFKGKDPSVDAERLAQEWVPGASVIYIGKASTRKHGGKALGKRLEEFRRFGAGEAVGHWGGRLVWQLADHRDLLVAWRATGPEDPEDVEAEMIDAFASVYGALPFANLKRGRRRAR